MRDFNHTVNVLVKSYLEHTLFHGSCAACAVGNIIADSTGRKVIGRNSWNNGFPTWDDVFVTAFGVPQPIEMQHYIGEAKKQIDSTGYSVKELARIESAFECVRGRDRFTESKSSEDEEMFNGLMAVLDVLAEIHNIDLTVREEAKLLFVKA